MKIVFTFVDYYLPGYKAGGPIRTISNMVEHLGDRFSFRVLTRDRDLDGVPYSDVSVNTWTPVGKGQVYYITPDQSRTQTIRRLLNEVQPDVVYLNSFFSTFSVSYLALRRLKLIPEYPTLLAPRGELSLGALNIKSLKKSSFLRLSNWIGLYSDLTWQASTPIEAEEIKQNLNSDIQIQVAPNLPSVSCDHMDAPALKKDRGSLRLVYLARIAPVKNLMFALRLLRNIPGDITFSVYGEADDASYWSICQNEAEQLPPNVNLVYHGAVPHDDVSDVFRQHHFMLLPTLGENFGHAIFEALHAGCPVIVSDRTPWNALTQAGAGWALPLEHPETWKQVVTTCVDMSCDRFDLMSSHAQHFAANWVEQSRMVENVAQLFKLA